MLLVHLVHFTAGPDVHSTRDNEQEIPKIGFRVREEATAPHSVLEIAGKHVCVEQLWWLREAFFRLLST